MNNTKDITVTFTGMEPEEVMERLSAAFPGMYPVAVNPSMPMEGPYSWKIEPTDKTENPPKD